MLSILETQGLCSKPSFYGDTINCSKTGAKQDNKHSQDVLSFLKFQMPLTVTTGLYMGEYGQLRQFNHHKWIFFFYLPHVLHRPWTLTKYSSTPTLSESIVKQFKTLGKRLKRDSLISSQSRKVLPSPTQEKKSNPVISSCMVANLHTQIEPRPHSSAFSDWILVA